MAALAAASDPHAHPEAGPPWQIAKVYWSVWSKARIVAMHEKFVELGLESPFSQEWLDRPGQDERITTHIDLGEHVDVRRDALLAHATQVDPTSKFWFGLPPEVARTVHPVEEWVLGHSEVEGTVPETDLFAGL